MGMEACKAPAVSTDAAASTVQAMLIPTDSSVADLHFLTQSCVGSCSSGASEVSAAEQGAQAQQHKDEGTASFKAGQHQEALQQYQAGLAALHSTRSTTATLLDNRANCRFHLGAVMGWRPLKTPWLLWLWMARR